MQRTILYTVEGRGAFPSDMLRYDDAKFATTEDATNAAALTTRRKINLIGTRHPTLGRWDSFLWRVV